MIQITPENFVFVGSLLLFAAVMAGKVAGRFGVPSLLLFLGVGLLVGSTLISFNSPAVVQFIGMIALSIILFTGGMDTSIKEIRPIAGAGITLATAGVFLTAIFVSLFVWLVSRYMGVALSYEQSLLLAAVISSTDSASVFSILRSKRQGLKENLRPLLELESGSNDPMAYILTMLIIGVIKNDGAASGWSYVWLFVVQMGLGVLAGYLLGRLAVVVMRRLNFDNKSFYPVLLLAFVFFIFSFADMIGGNGYLAAYIAGLVVGNSRGSHNRMMNGFFDGVTWLVQIVMFLALGLLVNQQELFRVEVIATAVAVALFMMFLGRPLAVLLSMLPFKEFSRKARTYVSWVGLRGAVPIIFATYPLVYGVPQAEFIFNVVFMVTIISLAVQGTTVLVAANRLGLSIEERKSSFSADIPDRLKSMATELEVDEKLLARGNMLKQISLPRNTLVVMVHRQNDYFIPGGDTLLIAGDKLLIISDKEDEVNRELSAMGVDMNKVIRIK